MEICKTSLRICSGSYKEISKMIITDIHMQIDN